jgi:DNA-binding protein H-NS
MSKKLNLDAMSIDEMWQLHEKIIQVLSARLTSEKRELEKRLAKLRRDRQMPGLEMRNGKAEDAVPERRKYPRVIPKYRNPDAPSETWSGRGKQPRWLTSAITAGHTIDEFTIVNGEPSNNGARRQPA